MDDKLKIISEAATAAWVDANVFDLNINEDTGKYSSWFLAFSTAGIGLIVVRFPSLIEHSWLGKTQASLILIVALVLLLIGVAMGILVHYCTKEASALKRQRLTLIKKQHVLLLSTSPIDLEASSFPQQIWNYELLSSDDCKKYKELEKKDNKLTSIRDIALTIQQAFAVLGYSLLVVASVYIAS